MPLLAPLGAASAGALVSVTKWWRIGLVTIALGLAAIWLAATPFFANWLDRRLQSEVPPVSIETLPQSDAVVLLGGVGLDFDNPANRIMHALQIYRAGKAPRIVYSGGDAEPLL